MFNDTGFYEIHYSFISSLMEIDAERYITSYDLNIYECFEDEKNDLIGKAKVKLLLVSQAIDNGYDVFDVFDFEGYLYELGQDIFDFENIEFNQEILDFYQDGIIGSNICIIERMEIIETHRNKGIGKKVIKDIHNRFAASCGLIIVQAYPLQFESQHKYDDGYEWSQKMKFNKLDSDFEKDFYQLKSFYQKLGFDHIEGFNHLMFLNTGFINKKLDKIKYE